MQSLELLALILLEGKPEESVDYWIWRGCGAM